MNSQRILYGLIAALILSGCASSSQPSVLQTVPPLDSSLAAYCKPLPEPPDGDYDELTDWMVDVVGLYGECASRHHAIVHAWPSN